MAATSSTVESSLPSLYLLLRLTGAYTVTGNNGSVFLEDDVLAATLHRPDTDHPIPIVSYEAVNCTVCEDENAGRTKMVA